MIWNVFISDISNNPILGLPLKSPINSSYKISSLRINDILISAVFSSLDSFSISKYLADLLSHLQTVVPILCLKSVKENYFILLDILKSPEFIFDGGIFNINENIFTNSDIFINTVEVVNRINNSITDNSITDNSITDNSITNNSITNNSIDKIFGEIFINNLPECINFLSNIKEGTKYKSPYPLFINGNSLSIKIQNPLNRNILSFYYNIFPYFSFYKSGEKFTFKSSYFGKFKFIEFKIPVNKNVYAEITRGEHKYSLEEGIIYWKFKNTEFKEESIKIIGENNKISRNIRVEFRIEEGETAVKIIGCSNGKNTSQKFWLRQTIQSGDYEFYY